MREVVPCFEICYAYWSIIDEIRDMNFEDLKDELNRYKHLLNPNEEWIYLVQEHMKLGGIPRKKQFVFMEDILINAHHIFLHESKDVKSFNKNKKDFISILKKCIKQETKKTVEQIVYNDFMYNAC